MEREIMEREIMVWDNYVKLYRYYVNGFCVMEVYVLFK